MSPRAYAVLYRAGRAGIKAANPTALVAIGETSNQGRDHPIATAAADSVAPGTFARLLARERGLLFDAYATHPYPTRPSAPPTEKVRWPNVTLSQLPRFEAALDRWFGRRGIPVWVTEYGYQTKPGDPLGVTEAQQARYLAQAMTPAPGGRARSDVHLVHLPRRVPWPLAERGHDADGRAKPSFKAFESLAQTMGGQTLRIKPGVEPTIKLPVPRLAYVTPVGSAIGVTYRVYRGRTMVAVGQPAPRLKVNHSVSFVAGFVPAPSQRYTIEMDAGDISGNHVVVTYSLVTADAAPPVGTLQLHR